MIRVYVAGAYSAENVIDVFGNMRRGIELSFELLKKGFAPFVPWFDYHFSLTGEVTLEEYYAYSNAWLLRSDAVLVVDHENSFKSEGVKKEIALANRLNIPVFKDPEKLYEWHGQGVSCAYYPDVIGLTGEARSGKDTIGRMLVDQYGYTRLAFADRLKEKASYYFGYTDEEIEEKGPQVRRILQGFGLALRDIQENYWINIVRDKMEPGKRYVITDVRFDNEAEFIRESGIIVHVSRPRKERIEGADHISEQGVGYMARTDYELRNDFSTVEELEREVQKFMKDLIG